MSEVELQKPHFIIVDEMDSTKRYGDLLNSRECYESLEGALLNLRKTKHEMILKVSIYKVFPK